MFGLGIVFEERDIGATAEAGFRVSFWAAALLVPPRMQTEIQREIQKKLTTRKPWRDSTARRGPANRPAESPSRLWALGIACAHQLDPGKDPKLQAQTCR
jgi:hypothetical protein